MTDIEAQGLDVMYGSPKNPAKIYDWEKSKRPKSADLLEDKTAASLNVHASNSDCVSLKHCSRTVTFIWAMDLQGAVHLAIEELAELPGGMESRGHPRRRDYPVHPATDKKLGHPTVLPLEDKRARIAGELFLDFDDTNKLIWFVNDNSGRYCKNDVPTAMQKQNVLELFKTFLGEQIRFDELGAVA